MVDTGTYIPRKKLRIVGFVQARMNSSRLWGKSMMPLGPGGYPVALHCYWRLKAAWPTVEEVWFLATDDLADKEIIDLAKSLHEPYIVRPEGGWNLAASYVQLCEAAKADIYLSIEADSPLGDTQMLQRQMPLFLNGAQYVIGKPPEGMSITAKPYLWSAGGVGPTPAWLWHLQHKYATDQYLKETPGPFMAMHPESLDEVPMPVAFFDLTAEDYKWYRPYHLSMEVDSDAVVLQIIYANLWKGPGPSNVINLFDALRYLDEHPEVVRYNAHVVDSVACYKAAEATKGSEAEIVRHYAMWQAMADPAAHVQKCKLCNCYLGHVREQSGRHWFVLSNGVEVKGRANVTCPKCGQVRNWYEDET